MSEEKLYIDDGELVYYINENEFFACDEIPTPMLEGIKHLQQKVEQQEKEIDRLNNKVSELENINEKIGLALNSAENKVDRLNNIINELEEIINYEIQEWKDTDDELMKARVQEDKHILEVIEELKENK